MQANEREDEADLNVPGCNGSIREEEYDPDAPRTLQEELNEIIKAFYAVVGEDDMRHYQKFAESISDRKVAEGALDQPDVCPSFELVDQDGDTVNLQGVLEKGPVVLQFYRGSWCPGCHAQLIRLEKGLPQFEEKGATLVAISPMLPDGTHYMSTKRDLHYRVCSDVGGAVAKQFNILFEVPEEFRDAHVKWDSDVQGANGPGMWEIPLPATFVIAQSGKIVWSFIDNDPFIRCEIGDIIAAIPSTGDKEGADVIDETKGDGHCKVTRKEKVNRQGVGTTFKTKFSEIKKKFGKEDHRAHTTLAHYFI